MDRKIIGIFLTTTIFLYGCSNRNNEWICESYNTDIRAGSNEISDEERLSRCIHRWAYKLAIGSASAQDTTNAVIAACQIEFDRAESAAINIMVNEKIDLFNKSVEFSKKFGRPRPNQENQLISDQDATSFERDFEKRHYKNAMFRVIQARAGKCDYINDLPIQKFAKFRGHYTYL